MLDARNQRRQHLVVFLREKRFRDDDRFHVDLLDTYVQFWQLISRVQSNLEEFIARGIIFTAVELVYKFLSDFKLTQISPARAIANKLIYQNS